MNEEFLVSPSNVEAEEALLGCILLDNYVWFEADSIGVTHDSFYRNAHKAIYRAMSQLYSAGMEIDTVTLAAKLEDNNELAIAGSSDYIRRLVDAIPMSDAAVQYAEIILEKARLRSIEAACYDALGEVAAPLTKADEVANKLRSTLDRVDLTGVVSESTMTVLKRVEEGVKALDRGTMLGMSTGHPIIDDGGGGFNPGGISAIVGKRGHGKTHLAFNRLRLASLANGLMPVGFLSGEMRTEELLRRQVTGMDIELAVRQEGWGQEQVDSLQRRVSKFAEAPIQVERTATNVDEVLRQMRILRHRYGCRVIAFDYVQKLYDRRAKSQVEAAEISMSRLSDFAKSNDCHLILLSQPDKIGNRIGVLQLREADMYGAWGQQLANEAETISFVVRPAKRHADAQMQKLWTELDSVGQANMRAKYGQLTSEEISRRATKYAYSLTLEHFTKLRFGENDFFAYWTTDKDNITWPVTRDDELDFLEEQVRKALAVKMPSSQGGF